MTYGSLISTVSRAKTQYPNPVVISSAMIYSPKSALYPKTGGMIYGFRTPVGREEIGPPIRFQPGYKVIDIVSTPSLPDIVNVVSREENAQNPIPADIVSVVMYSLPSTSKAQNGEIHIEF